MSLKRNSFNADGKLHVLRLKTKDAANKPISPIFEISQKNDAGKWTVVDTTTFVSGDLVKIELKEKEWENEKYNIVNIYLKDEKDLYLIDLRLNMLSRSLFNQLFSLKTFSGLSISTYTAKSKKDNTKEYPAISLRQNDELIHWKYGLDELPKPTSVTFKGKTMNDYSTIDNMFIEKLIELSKLLNKSNVQQSSQEQKLNTESVEQSSSKKEDDVPF